MASVGKLNDVEVTAIEPGLIRLDLMASVPPDHLEEARYGTVIDLTTARALTIALIETINKMEVNEAIKKKAKKK